MNTKDLILKSAYTEFLQYGYNGSSMNRIAKSAGMTKPALYYHFTDKSSLFNAVFQKYFKKLEQFSLPGPDRQRTTKEKIYAFVKYFLTIQFEQIMDLDAETQNAFHHYFFIFDALNHNPDLKEVYNESIENTLRILRGYIDEGQRTGEIRKGLDTEAFILNIGVMIEGLTVVSVIDDTETFLPMFDRMFELLWSSVK